MFVLVTVHGFTAGADNMNLAVQWVALTRSLLVIFLLTFRFLVRAAVAGRGIAAPLPSWIGSSSKSAVRPLLHEAREPAVGEHLAAGLTLRAVHDFV